jgi:hypothetical protein
MSHGDPTFSIDRDLRTEAIENQIKNISRHNSSVQFMSFIPLFLLSLGHISRLLSKIALANCESDLRSSYFSSTLDRFYIFSQFHVNETDIMYNTKFSATLREDVSKNIQLPFQLLLMLLHDSHFLPNETQH